MSEIKHTTGDGQEVTFRKEGTKLVAEIEVPEGFEMESLAKKIDADKALGISCHCSGGLLASLGEFL